MQLLATELSTVPYDKDLELGIVESDLFCKLTYEAKLVLLLLTLDVTDLVGLWNNGDYKELFLNLCHQHVGCSRAPLLSSIMRELRTFSKEISFFPGFCDIMKNNGEDAVVITACDGVSKKRKRRVLKMATANVENCSMSELRAVANELSIPMKSEKGVPFKETFLEKCLDAIEVGVKDKSIPEDGSLVAFFNKVIGNGGSAEATVKAVDTKTVEAAKVKAKENRNKKGTTKGKKKVDRNDDGLVKGSTNDVVLALIRKHEKGMKKEDIMEKGKLGDGQVRNAIYQLKNKLGKIKTDGKGVFVVA